MKPPFFLPMTVIDFNLIIQGLIPKTLTTLLNSMTHSKEKTYIIINNCMKKLTKNSLDIIKFFYLL